MKARVPVTSGEELAASAIAPPRTTLSTTMAVPGRDIFIEDRPTGFADAVNRLLSEPDLAARIGRSARQLALERYGWNRTAGALEGFYRRVLEIGS